MRLLNMIAYTLMTTILLAVHMALAVPFTGDSAGVPEDRSLNEQDDPVPPHRGFCMTMFQAVHKIATHEACLVFITGGSRFAEKVCNRLKGQDCEEWVDTIRSGFDWIITGIVIANYAIGRNPPGQAPPVGTAHQTEIMLKEWQTSFNERGIHFDAIDVLPFDSATAALKHRDGDPKLLARVRFTGMANTNRATNAKHNMVANFFEGNNTVLELPASIPEGDLSQGYDSYGFKITVASRTQSSLSPSHQDAQAYWLARDWYTKSH